MAVLTASLLAGAVVLGVPAALVALGVVSVWNPAVALAAVLSLALVDRARNGRRVDDGEALMLRMLGAELAAGASVRHGVAALAERYRTPGLDRAARLAMAGVPMPEVSARLNQAMPVNGRLLAAATVLGSRTGSGLYGLVQRLAERAEREAELRREVRAATAQARLSTLVVGVAPLAFTGFLIATGAVPAPWRSDGVLAIVAGCGVVLEVAGFVAVVVLLRGHAR